MVWGMNMPRSFGEFWPDGEFEGWDDRLRAHFTESMPEEQKLLFEDENRNGMRNYSSFAVGKFINEVGTVVREGDVPFTPVEPHEAPEYFLTTKGYQTLGALINLNNRILAVNDALKAIIERFEPGVHRFFPIAIRMPRGKIFPAQYYTLVIGNYRESFSPASSKPDAFKDMGLGFFKHQESAKGVAGLALSKAAIGSAHLWRERKLREWLTCFSDELQGEIARAGLRIPKHWRMMEI